MFEVSRRAALRWLSSQSELLDLLASLRSSNNVDMVRTVLERMLQELIEAEATAAIGAVPDERTDPHDLRNGHRDAA